MKRETKYIYIYLVDTVSRVTFILKLLEKKNVSLFLILLFESCKIQTLIFSGENKIQ